MDAWIEGTVGRLPVHLQRSMAEVERLLEQLTKEPRLRATVIEDSVEA